MINWTISIVERPEAGDYAITQRSGFQSHTFYRKLPPDLMAELGKAAGDDPWSGMKWRRPRNQINPGEMFFNAGDRATLARVGEQLFNALFTVPPEFTVPPDSNNPQGNSLGDVLMNERAHATQGNSYLNITLDLSKAPQLVAVPWEALYFSADGGRFLATDVATNVVRVLPLAYSMPLPQPVKGPLRVLIVISNPGGDLPALDVEFEREKIENKLRPIQTIPRDGEQRAAFTILPAVTNATRAKLRNAIRDHKPHILHYSGHGVSGAIAMEVEGEPGKADLIDTDALRQIVQNDPPWLTFLNSCEGAQATPSLFGGTAQGLLANNVPFVVAMQFSITDKAAILFADEFYRAIAAGLPVVQAVSRGRNTIATEVDVASELSTPVLYSSGRAETIELADSELTTAPSPTDEPPVRTETPLKPWIIIGGLALVAVAAAGIFIVGSSGSRSPVVSEEGRGVVAPAPAVPEEVAGSSSGGLAPTSPPPAVRPPRGDRGDRASSDGAGRIQGGAIPPPPSPPPVPVPPPPPPPPPPMPVPPPPAPPPPPGPVPLPLPFPSPPPPPPPLPCNKGPYIVFFDWDKSDITPEAASILDSAVATYGNCANVPLMLSGYADRSGKPTYNQGLSERRNASVTQYLTDRGIPAGVITSQGFGENNNRIPTADSVRELQNRRVEIVFGPATAPELPPDPSPVVPRERP